ncbi:MAG: QueT transporter family protein [Clostridiales bacterium]|nr:QueT transporter family protein [Clostridiales bacterium]
MKKQFTIQSLAAGGIIAALYVALTLLFAPISFSQIQFRISETLTLLPVLSASSVPGLFIGCLVANLITGQPWQDVVFGSLASLLAAVLTRRFRDRLWLAALMPVAVNALIIGLMLWLTYGLHPYISILTVGAGQALVCYLLGIPLVRLMENRKIQVP